MNEKGKPVFVEFGGHVAASAFNVRRTVSFFCAEGGDRIGYHRQLAANGSAFEQVTEFATDERLNGDYIAVTSCPGETPMAIPFNAEPQAVQVTFS